jgi:predicted  nucleic acid-binding Zn-ribbon protein
MVRLFEAMTEGSEEYVPPRLDLKPGRAFEALRLAIVQAETEVRRGGDRSDDTSKAIEHVREAAAFRDSAERRVRDLEAALEAVREGARRDLKAALDRAEQAEALLAAEAKRTASAERRLQIAEDRLDQVMSVIESELTPRTARS